MLYILLILLVAIVLVVDKLILPSRRFFSKAASAIDLYNMLEATKQNAKEQGIDVEHLAITIDYSAYHYQFQNLAEAYDTVEKMCNEALDLYIYLVNLNIASNEAREEKDMLITICNNVRLERWKKG